MYRLAKELLKRHLPGPVAWCRRLRGRDRPLRQWPRLTSRPPAAPPSVLDCCIAYNEHGGYCVPLASRHRLSVQTVLDGRVWEPDTLAFLASLPDDLVHAGAYFGDFLPALARSRAAGDRVWAFEPNPENYRCASVTAEINGLANVELRNAGLGERRSTPLMRLWDADGRALGGMSHVLAADAEAPPADVARVAVVTVDEAFPSDRKLSALQLDVEGFEVPALMGALATIRRCRPVIVVESVPDEAWLTEHLFPQGYRAERKIHDNTVFVPR